MSGQAPNSFFKVSFQYLDHQDIADLQIDDLNLTEDDLFKLATTGIRKRKEGVEHVYKIEALSTDEFRVPQIGEWYYKDYGVGICCKAKKQHVHPQHIAALFFTKQPLIPIVIENPNEEVFDLFN